MRGSCNIVGGSFFGADLEPGTFHAPGVRGGQRNPVNDDRGERVQQAGCSLSSTRRPLPPDGYKSALVTHVRGDVTVPGLKPGAAAA